MSAASVITVRSRSSSAGSCTPSTWAVRAWRHTTSYDSYRHDHIFYLESSLVPDSRELAGNRPWSGNELHLRRATRPGLESKSPPARPPDHIFTSPIFRLADPFPLPLLLHLTGRPIQHEWYVPHASELRASAVPELFD